MPTLLVQLRAFFRPRSRSRSQHNPPADTMHEPPSSYVKAAARVQTRPISSTTIATHSTITPLPSDSLRNRLIGPYTFQPHTTHSHTVSGDNDTPPYDSGDHRFPRSETPSSTRRKLLWHSLFGISLARRSSSPSAPQKPCVRKGSTSTSISDPSAKSSRKRSFRLTSRPATPKSADDASSSKSPFPIPIPSSPLPLSASPRRRSFGLGSSQRSTPKSSATHLPLPHTQSPQNGRSHGRRHSVGSERPPHDSAVALSEESHRSAHKPTHPPPDGGPRNKGKERENFVADSGGPPLPDLSSQSLPIDPCPISRSFVSSNPAGHPVFSHLPTLDSVSSDENERSSLLPPNHLPVIPRIIHTPPTPQRPGELAIPLSGTNTDPPTVDPGKAEAPKPKTVTIAHREQVLVSDSQSHTDPQHSASSKGRFTPRIFGGKDLPRVKESNGQKPIRRPPVPLDGSVHKAPNPNVTSARNMTNHRGKLGSFDFERPVSALNRSSSTVDQQDTHVSKNNSRSKTHLHALERTISGDSAPSGQSHSVTHQPWPAESSVLNPVHTGDTSVVSFSSVSLQTMSTGKGIGSNPPAEQSSSWGRASGRRTLRTSHGTFAFEHPSSVPNSPNPRKFNLPIGPNQNEGHTSSLSQSHTTSPLHAIFDERVKHARGQSSDHLEPGYSKPDDRKSAKGKGRSLDLGLGLSWAPSRLREEVLMPGLILTREKAKLDKTKTNGSDVTQVFETVLSEPRFRTFKEYVHSFDAHVIPLEGPSGLLNRVENLLAETGLGERERNKLMADFTVFVENHSG